MPESDQSQEPEDRLAIVSRIFGAYYSILPEPDLQPELLAVLRGRLRLDKGEPRKSEKQDKQRNPIAVGDQVIYSTEEGTEEVVARERRPRMVW